MKQLESLRGNMLFSTYMLDLDRTVMTDSEKYRCYMALMSVIRDMLEECGINMRCKGFLYMQDCIIAIFDQKKLDLDFKNDVYPCVAIKYGVSNPESIEHSIRYAITSAYHGQINTDICRAAGIMDRFEKRPTNKEFLLFLTREAYRRLWHESVEFARF